MTWIKRSFALRDPAVKLSIVATLYRSARGLQEFHQRCMAAAAATTDEVEMILVDDGSPDDSLDVALALQADDPRVIVVELARNFGHHKAMMTGLQHATGDLVFLLDSDLEEPPEALSRFHAKLEGEGWDVVFGVQRARRGGFFERITGKIFYRIIESLSDRSIPQNLLTARLMRRDYVDALIAHQDRSFQMSDLWVLTGFRQAPMEMEKLALSPTTYSFARRIRMAVDHVTTTSTRLLYLIFYCGLALSGTAHWMFDRGLISLADDLTILVSRQVNDPGGVAGMIYASGKARAPERRSDRPHTHYLRWHREHCFKN